MILSLIVSGIFFGLGGIHFNWVLGGTFGFEASLPTKENGERVLHPSKMESAIVGTGLGIFGIFYLLRSGLLEIYVTDWMNDSLGWIIPCIFLMRAVGEFRYVGFFKRIKKTDFALWDTRLFSPLCLGIAIIGILIQLYR